jgi:hypothetical protein
MVNGRRTEMVTKMRDHLQDIKNRRAPALH